MQALHPLVLQIASPTLGAQLLGGLHNLRKETNQDGQPIHRHQEDRRDLIHFIHYSLVIYGTVIIIIVIYAARQSILLGNQTRTRSKSTREV